jgi:hypothetical protein
VSTCNRLKVPYSSGVQQRASRARSLVTALGLVLIVIEPVAHDHQPPLKTRRCKPPILQQPAWPRTTTPKRRESLITTAIDLPGWLDRSSQVTVNLPGLLALAVLFSGQ